MYLTMDLFTPRMGEYLLNSKAKNRVLNHWMRKLEGGEEVFDKLYLYNGSVLETADHKKLYQIMGIDADELRETEFDGVDSLWLYFSRKKIVEKAAFTNQELFDYVQSVTDEGTTYTTVLNFVSSYPISLYNDPNGFDDMLVGIARDNSIVDSINNPISSFNLNNTSQPYSTFNIVNTGIDGHNNATFVALQDVNEVLFSRNVKVGITKIVNSDTNEYGIPYNTYYTTSVSISFTIKPSTTVGECTALFDRVRNSDYIEEQFYYNIEGVDPTGVFNSNGSVRVAAVEAMTSREFGLFFKGAIDQDYKEEEAEWWEILLAVILFIIVAWLFPPLAATLGATTVATMAALFITIATIVFTIATLILQMAGNYSAVIFFGKVLVILGKIGAVLGIIAAFQNILNLVAKAITATINGGMNAFKMLFSAAQSAMQFESQIEGLSESDKQNETQDAEHEADTMNTPQGMELMKYNFDSYNFLDINEQMDNMVYNMTEGKIEQSTTKYFS